MRIILLLGLILVVPHGPSACFSQALLGKPSQRDEQLLKAAAHVWSWYQYWHPTDNALTHYVIKRPVRVLTEQLPDVAGLCAPDLETCMGFNVSAAGEMVAPDVWDLEPPGSKQDAADFLRENLASKKARAQYTFHSRGQQGPHSFDPGKFSDPIPRPSLPPDRFTENQFTYPLPSLAAPLRLAPDDLDAVKARIQWELRIYFAVDHALRRQATIPLYSRQDPWLYVAADFGRCGRGILIMGFTPSLGWRGVQFTMADDAIAWFGNRIAKVVAARVEIK